MHCSTDVYYFLSVSYNHDITEILLKVALITTTRYLYFDFHKGKKKINEVLEQFYEMCTRIILLYYASEGWRYVWVSFIG